MNTQLLKNLISIDSVSKEKNINDFIEKYLKEKFGDILNYEKDVIREDGSYNLIVSNSKNPKVLLAGHVDTVPYSSISQLEPKEIDGKIYGRGAVDMKAGVFINIELIDYMLKNNIEFWNIFYCDEESDFLGMRDFAKRYMGKISPKITIVPEPTNGKIIHSFRGMGVFKISIKGKTAHSGKKDLGINAIEGALEYTKAAEKFIKEKDSSELTTSLNLAGINGGIIQDGQIIIKDNIVPDYCSFIFSIRLGNFSTFDEFKIFSEDFFKKRGIIIDKFNYDFWVKPMIQDGIEDKYGEICSIGSGKNFGYSDIQYIKEYIGGDCLLLGPGPGKKAHCDDEYVEIKSILEVFDKIKKIISL